MKRRVAVLTGSRAEYGLFYWLLKEIEADAKLELQLLVTGTHLSSRHGKTVDAITADGFEIDSKIDLALQDDSAAGICRSMAKCVAGVSEELQRLKPDFLVLLGDRYETLMAASAALIQRVPVAHLCGGDRTEGAYDESIRHAVTKLSHLHFVTSADARKRVVQMGENPDHVFELGSLSLENIRRMNFLSRKDLQKTLGLRFYQKNLLVTFHPETLSTRTSQELFQELLTALEKVLKKNSDLGIIFTYPNADTEGAALIGMVDEFAKTTDRVKAFASLGQERYLSLMNEVDVVVGNSSSGLYDAPALKKPSVNIGDRQKGRLSADSVLHCKAQARAVFEAIENAFSLDCSKVKSPYGDGQTATKIKNVLRDFKSPESLLQKGFFS